jgi:hypothetical protein
MIIKTKSEFPGDADAARIAADMQAERLLKLWDEARSRAEAAPMGSPAFARMADLAAAYVALAMRAGRMGAARGMAGKALAALREACRREKRDVARHLAFARVLELAAACEVHAGDARAAFDTLRAALVVLGPFSPMLRDRATDPLVRLALAESLVRPLTSVARMLEDAPQRRAAHAQAWDETRAWAKAAKGAADHPSAVEAAVLCAFELAVERRRLPGALRGAAPAHRFAGQGPRRGCGGPGSPRRVRTADRRRLGAPGRPRRVRNAAGRGRAPPGRGRPAAQR